MSGLAWEEVETRLRPFVRRRVATEADADDVLQEVLLRAHRGLAGLRSPDRLGPWLFGIARSALADHGRSRARHPLVDGEVPEAVDLPAEADDPALAALAAFAAALVDQLPADQRDALRLAEAEGNQRRAAERAGLSVSGFKSRVQRGRARLRAMLEDCCAIALDARGRVVACEPRQGDCACAVA